MACASDGLHGTEVTCSGQHRLLLDSPVSLAATETQLHAAQQERVRGAQCLDADLFFLSIQRRAAGTRGSWRCPVSASPRWGWDQPQSLKREISCRLGGIENQKAGGPAESSLGGCERHWSWRPETSFLVFLLSLTFHSWGCPRLSWFGILRFSSIKKKTSKSEHS